jgi:DNA modification methylase
MKIKSNKIYCIDVLKGLKKLPEDSIDCIVTSPPYWALRDYKNKNQIGLEDHPQNYINKIVEIMKECKRVLKPTGTIWLNLGDSFYSGTGNEKTIEFLKNHKLPKNIRGKFKNNWLQHKQRLLIPFRIAIKCQDELGLILRNDITWIKQWCNFKTKDSAGASMPCSVKDRLNTNSESIFLFVKNPRYFFDLDKIRVPYNDKNGTNSKGKNPGDCIVFPLEPSKERHFAMFPKTLPEFCIRAGAPEQVCKRCGIPRLIVETGGNSYAFNFRVRDTKKNRLKHLDRKASDKEIKNYNEAEYTSKKQKKLILGCSCNSGFKPGIVLDPFIGSGTTAIVAENLGMNFLGFDLNKDYIKISNRRLKNAKVY